VGGTVRSLESRACAGRQQLEPPRQDRAPNAPGGSPGATAGLARSGGAADGGGCACCCRTRVSSARNLDTSHTMPARSLCRSANRESWDCCVCCTCFSMLASLEVTWLSDELVAAVAACLATLESAASLCWCLWPSEESSLDWSAFPAGGAQGRGRRTGTAWLRAGSWRWRWARRSSSAAPRACRR
jgi:hypothetical protein